MSSGTPILITGSTGFVGTALVREAIARGETVIGLTRDTASAQARSLAEETGCTLLSVADANGIAGALEDHRFKAVIHAASPGTRPADRDWATLRAGCLDYTHALLAALGDRVSGQFVQVGSWSEYALPLPDQAPVDESHSLTSRHLYGSVKAAAHLSGQAYANALGMRHVTGRLFNVFGPGESEQRLLPHIITHLRRGEPVDLTSGLQGRDFVYIDDAVDALLRLALPAAPLDHGCYNVASGTATTVREMAEAAANCVGADLALLRFGALPQRADEPVRVCGDASRLKSETGWQVQTNWIEGVQRLVTSITST